MENLVVSANKKFTMEKYMSQVKIVAQNGIKKILNISAKSNVVSCESNGGVVAISGKLKVDVLYLTQTDIIDFASGETDFIEKQKSQFELHDLFAVDKNIVEDVNFSSNEMICSVSHNTEIIGVYNYELPSFDNDAGAVVNHEFFKSSKFICLAEDNFCVAENSETNLSNVQILKSNAEVVVDDVVCSVDKVVIEGKVLADVIYLDNDGCILTMLKQIDFKQEIAAENVVPNMKALAYVNLKNSSVIFEEKDGKNELIYNFDVAVKSYVFEDCELSVAKDMFVLNNDISVVYDYIETKNYVEMVESAESVLTQTDITDIANFDDIIGVFEPKIELTSIDDFENKTEVNAKISAYALYKGNNLIDKINIEREVKFEISKEINKFVDDVYLNCQIVSFKVKAGKEIEIAFKFNCHANLAMKSYSRYVKNYEIVASKLKDDAGIKVYVVKENQSVFDIAKALNVLPEMIISQNQVDDVFEAGQKVYVYSPINLA